MAAVGRLQVAFLIVALSCADAILSAPSSTTLCDADHCACPQGGAWGNVTCVCTDNQKDVVLRDSGPLRIPDHTTALLVVRCARVEVMPLALQNLRHLLRVELRDVGEVVVSTRSFSRPLDQGDGAWPAAHVLLLRCGVPTLPSHTFQGRIRSVALHNTTVGAVAAFAFASLYATERVELSGCVFDAVEPQAFKSFSVKCLILRDSTFGNLPSRFVMDVEVSSELRMERVSVQRMHSASLQVHGPRAVHISDCVLAHVEGEAFRITSEGPIQFQNNYFASLDPGALRGFSVGRVTLQVSRHQDLVFNNNTLLHFTEESFQYNSTVFRLKLHRVNIQEQCSGEAIRRWGVFLGGASIWCLEGGLYQEATREQCEASNSVSLLLILGAVGTGTVILFVALLAICLWRRRRARSGHWSSVSPKTKKVKEENRMAMVLPDGRTYRETELHIIVEKAEPLVEPAQDPLVK